MKIPETREEAIAFWNDCTWHYDDDPIDIPNVRHLRAHWLVAWELVNPWEATKTAPFDSDLATDNYPMPRFIQDLAVPMFNIIRGLPEDRQKAILGNHWTCAEDSKKDEPHEYPQSTLELALDGFLWNIQINQPTQGGGKDNALMLFMEVAHNVWLETNQPMPNTKESYSTAWLPSINQSKDEVKR